MVFKQVIRVFFIVSALFSSNLYALDLSDVITLAFKHDTQLQVAYADYLVTTENEPQSQAGLLPDINLQVFTSGTSSETSNSPVGSVINNGTSTFNASGYTLSLTQTLYNKKLFDTLDQSKAEVAQALALYQAAKQDMMIRAATSYFDVLAAIDNLSFTQSERQAIRQQLEQSTARFEAGLIAITDVKESQAQFDIALAQEITAENTLENTKEQLQVLTNTQTTKLNPLQHGITLSMPEPATINHWKQSALENNLALRAAYYAVTAANEKVSASKSDYYPTLNLNISHDYASSDGSTNGSTFGGRDTKDTHLSLNLDIPIYSGGQTQSKHRVALAQQNKANANLAGQKRLTDQQTRTAFRGIKSAIAQAHALNKALESTQSASEATQAGFEVGTRTSVDVLLAQREQHKSERNFSRALYDYILNILELKRSAGTLSTNDISKVNQWLIH